MRADSWMYQGTVCRMLVGTPTDLPMRAAIELRQLADNGAFRQGLLNGRFGASRTAE
jgi:hypothetical protein